VDGDDGLFGVIEVRSVPVRRSGVSSGLQEQSIITVPDLIDRHFKGVNRDQVDRLFLILPFLAPHQELTRGDKGAGDIESFFEKVAARSFHGQMSSQTLMPLL